MHDTNISLIIYVTLTRVFKVKIYTGLDTKQCKNVNIFLPINLTHVFGAQKNRLIETVLLSTHSICRNNKITFSLHTLN